MNNHIFYDSERICNAVITVCDPIYIIPDDAFKNNSCIEQLNIQSHALYIGKSAFNKCYMLRKINFANDIPQTVVIDDAAFSYTALEHLEVPNNVRLYLKNSTFNNCKHLKTVYIASKISLLNEVFANCTKLSCIQLDNCKYIDSTAFKNCPALKLNCKKS